MKVIVWHNLPFALAHGGFETMTERIMARLNALGVEVEPERWWDASQRGDILHYFGRPTDEHVRLAKAKGYRIVMTDVLDRTAGRSPGSLAMQALLIKAMRRFGGSFCMRMGWSAYQQADAVVHIVEREREVAAQLFGCDRAKMHVISHGLDDVAIEALGRPADEPGDYLISVGTIDPRKNSLFLARAARQAGVPLVFLGKPYDAQSGYMRDFMAEMDGKLLRYGGFVDESAKRVALRNARGFVLLSDYESGCIAVYEAATAGLPMLLADRPWARQSYPNSAAIHLAPADLQAWPARLATFHSVAGRQSSPIFTVPSWRHVAQRYAAIYESILKRSHTLRVCS